MSDGTGFGLRGHVLEGCNGSGVAARLDYSAIPVWPRGGDLADRGCVTGASARNWAACCDSVERGSK